MIESPLFESHQASLGEFTVVAGDAHDGFITTSPNGHYFNYPNGDMFFPVGMNLWEGAFDCSYEFRHNYVENQWIIDGIEADGEVVDPCSSYWLDGDESLCCGLTKENMYHRYKSWDPSYSVREMCLPLVSYIKLGNAIDQISVAGGNAFRIPLMSSSLTLNLKSSIIITTGNIKHGNWTVC
jgi:hypothetical protein